MKNRGILNIIIVVVCTLMVLGTLIMCVKIYNRLGRLEKMMGISNVEIGSAGEEAVSKDLVYDTVEIYGIQFTYPASGKVGNDDQYIEIESLTLKGSDDSDFNSDYTVGMNFIGTNSHSNAIFFSAKQYDEDGFCIKDSNSRIDAVKGERIKKYGALFIEKNAKTVIVEILP